MFRRRVPLPVAVDGRGRTLSVLARSLAGQEAGAGPAGRRGGRARPVSAAGSRGPFDVVAFGAEDVRLIQVKSTQALNRHGNVTVFADAILPLLTLAIPPVHVSRWLFVKVLRGAWHRLQVDGYPIERAALLDRVNGVLQAWQAEDRQRAPEVKQL